MVNQPSVYRPGQWRSVVGQLVASGHFRVVVSDGPLALLQLTDP